MKGNSTRIPKKNLKIFGKTPLYHAIVKALISSQYVKAIVIDTDCTEIAKDAKEHFGEKITIVNRPLSIQGDFVSMNEIIAHDLSQLEGEVFIQTHSTNPLLKSETIDSAIEKYFKSAHQFDSLFSVTKIQTRFYDKDVNPINHNLQELLRTQDLEPMYEENSNFYVFSKKSFEEASNKRIGLRPQMFIVDKLEAVDIDDPEDFKLAELLYKDK